MGSQKSERARFPRPAHEGREAVTRSASPSAVQTDKSLGQHWLISERVIQTILSKASGLAGVLEVGPGIGVLTHPLSEVSEVIAVEFDTRVLAVLAESAPRAEIVHGDALQVPLGDLLDKLPLPTGIVSNMPYNITGPLLDKFCQVREKVSVMILMMQLEVGDKILAQVGDRKRGALSVAMQAHFDIKRVMRVPPGAFRPPPKVDSIVLEFTPRSDVPAELPSLLRVVRAGFSHPRKTLANNLKALIEPEQIVSLLQEHNTSQSIRAHEAEFGLWEAFTTHVRQ